MVSLFGSEWVSWLPPPNHEEGFSADARLPKQLAPGKPREILRDDFAPQTTLMLKKLHSLAARVCYF
jgi:hypothetical protein